MDGSYAADLLPGFLLIGVGLGFAFVPVSIAALSGATGEEAGLQSGLINTNQQIGGAIGLAILISISTTRSDNLIEDGVAQLDALTDGYSLAFWVAAGFAILGVIVTLFALKREDLVMEDAQPASADVGLDSARPQMAVPKRKTSKSRRDKRRAQHKIEAPRLSVCPVCGQPKESHRMCPTCKTYRGREVEPLRAPTA